MPGGQDPGTIPAHHVNAFSKPLVQKVLLEILSRVNERQDHRTSEQGC